MLKGRLLRAARCVCCLLALACLPIACRSQEADELHIVFYNVENLFDTEDDSLTNDEEFLPWGIRGWTPTRFWNKIGNIARVLAVLDFPVLVGVAEVENAGCLSRLTRASPLKTAGYAFVHYDSPDARGVDVGLLYNPYLFTPGFHQPIRIAFPGQPDKKTRDVLYVRGELFGVGEMHVFVAHFPSRLGGEKATDALRYHVASCIRSRIDSVLMCSSDAKIVVMGDFNDYPNNRSLQLLVRGEQGGGTASATASSTSVSGGMVNVMNKSKLLKRSRVKGSHKYQAAWDYLDQFVVSDSLAVLVSAVKVCDRDFLLQADKRWLGVKPYRTFDGMTWKGGYSDHLPIVLTLQPSRP